MLQRAALVPTLNDNVSRFRTLLHADVNSDAQFRFIECAGTRLCVLYIEGMADDRKISDFILRACVEHATEQPRRIDAAYLMEKVVEIAQCEAEQRVSEILDSVVTGMTAVLIDGCDEAVMLETRGYPARQVNRTTNESVVIGAQEGFVESLRTNMTLMRRYVPCSDLITECVSVGTQVPARVTMVYLGNVADSAVVDAVRRRLKGIDAGTVQGLGAVQQHIEDYQLDHAAPAYLEELAAAGYPGAQELLDRLNGVGFSFEIKLEGAEGTSPGTATELSKIAVSYSVELRDTDGAVLVLARCTLPDGTVGRGLLNANHESSGLKRWTDFPFPTGCTKSGTVTLEFYDAARGETEEALLETLQIPFAYEPPTEDGTPDAGKDGSSDSGKDGSSDSGKDGSSDSGNGEKGGKGRSAPDTGRGG